MEELIACPFCGSTLIRRPMGEDGYLCKSCGSVGYDWQNRPGENALRAEVAQLKAQITSLCPIGDLVGLSAWTIERQDFMERIAELEGALEILVNFFAAGDGSQEYRIHEPPEMQQARKLLYPPESEE